jgi:hypothetical protein
MATPPPDTANRTALLAASQHDQAGTASTPLDAPRRQSKLAVLFAGIGIVALLVLSI